MAELRTIGNCTSVGPTVLPPYSLISSTHLWWLCNPFAEMPMTFTFRFAKSSERRATSPSSVVHTGVKSPGCENKIAYNQVNKWVPQDDICRNIPKNHRSIHEIWSDLRWFRLQNPAQYFRGAETLYIFWGGKWMWWRKGHMICQVASYIPSLVNQADIAPSIPTSRISTQYPSLKFFNGTRNKIVDTG